MTACGTTKWKPRRTKKISPSHLGLAEKCLLSYLFVTERPHVTAVPVGIEALMGSAVHSLIGSWRSNPGIISNDWGRAWLVNRIWDEIETHATMATVMNAAGITRGSTDFVAVRDLIAQLSFAARSMNTMPRRPRFPGRRKLLSARTSRDWSGRFGEMFGFEREVESECWPIKGRIDLLERTGPDNVKITEFKTGNCVDTDHQINEDAYLQLLGYGLLVRERLPGVAIDLRLICRNGIWQRRFSEEDHETIVSIVRTLCERLENKEELQEHKLASPGRHCKYCRYRPNCETYKAWAQDHWGDSEATATLPLDCWGEMCSFTETDDVVGKLKLQRYDGCQITLRHVPSIFLRSSNLNTRHLSVYSMKSYEVGRGNRMPLNYYAVDGAEKWKSAFQVIVV